jgi:hypothetical protein
MARGQPARRRLDVFLNTHLGLAVDGTARKQTGSRQDELLRFALSFRSSQITIADGCYILRLSVLGNDPSRGCKIMEANDHHENQIAVAYPLHHGTNCLFVCTA